jgi:TonB-dependent SusC/RagA subfamily outer membrane receptor
VISTAAVLQQLPPEVIESVNIIKGGSGAALYGSQGINGVVVVTPKEERNQKDYLFP